MKSIFNTMGPSLHIRTRDGWTIYHPFSGHMWIYHMIHSPWGVLYSKGHCGSCTVQVPSQIVRDFLLLNMGETQIGREMLKEILRNRRGCNG